MTCSRLITSSPLSTLEAVTQYLFVEDGLHPVFREEVLLDLEVRPWCGDTEHNVMNLLFHGMLVRCLALRLFG